MNSTELLVYANENGYQGDFTKECVELSSTTELFERSSQTAFLVSKSQSTTREQGTQVVLSKSSYSTRSDKIISPTNAYVTADELDATRISSVIYIQRLIRGMMGRRRVRRIRREKEELEMRIREDAQKHEAIEKEWREFSQARRSSPKTIYDLQLLESELREWTAEETKRLKEKVSGSPDYRHDPKYVAGMKRILAESIKFREKIRIKRDDNVYVYKPKYVVSRSGEVTEIQSEPRRILVEIFNDLMTEPPRSHAIRESIIVKALEDPAMNNPELIELMERELFLLRKKRPLKSMPGLRLRIRNTFRELIGDL